MGKAKQINAIAEFLGEADRLRRKSEFVTWIPRILNLVLFASLLIGILIRVSPIMDEKCFITLVIALIFGSSTIASVIIFTRTRSLIEKARYADKKLNLQERASTFAEIQQGTLSVDPEVEMKQLVNTNDSIERLVLRRVISPTLSRKDLATLLVMIAILIVNIFVPNPQYEIIKQENEIERSISEQMLTLEKMGEEIASDSQLDEESRDAILDPLRNAIETLQQGEISREEALAILSQAEKELRELGTGFYPALDQRALAEAGQALRNNPFTDELGVALEGEDIARAAQATAVLKEVLSDLDGKTRSDLAQDLANAGAVLRGTDPKVSDVISGAAQAIQDSDDEHAQELLADLVTKLEDVASQKTAAGVAESTANQVAAAGQEVAGFTQAGNQISGQSNINSSEGAGNQASDGADGQAAGTSSESSSEVQQGPGSPGRGGGRAESVFTPDMIDLGTQSGVPVELPANCADDNDGCGLLLNESPVDFANEGSVIPYTEVFVEYRDSAYEALERDQFPLSMKDYIRDYFISLEP